MRYRLLLGLGVLLMLTPTFLYFAGPLRSPLTFEGDHIVELKCRQIEGRYVAAKDGPEVRQFILPGPHRPVRVIGTVHDRSDSRSRIAQAHVKLVADGVELNKETSPDGQFGLDLPPGRYTLEISASGYKPHVQEYVVEHSSEPIPAQPVEYAWKFVDLPLGLEPVSER